MSDRIHHCTICDTDYKTASALRDHEKRLIHKKKANNKNLLSTADNEEEFYLDIKNKKGEVIHKTKVDKDVYKHILVHNYPVWYCKGYVQILYKDTPEYLHSYIYYVFHNNKFDPEKPIIDHDNRKPMDNTYANLKAATDLANGRNKSKSKNASSQYYGVVKRELKGIWEMNILINGKITSRSYKNELHAAYHYDLLVIEYNLKGIAPMNNIEKPKDFILKVFVKKDDMPKGIYKDYNRYYYDLCGKHVYGFGSIEEALAARNAKILEKQMEKEKILINTPITRNKRNIAIVSLFNKANEKV